MVHSRLIKRHVQTTAMAHIAAHAGKGESKGYLPHHPFHPGLSPFVFHSNRPGWQYPRHLQRPVDRYLPLPPDVRILGMDFVIPIVKFNLHLNRKVIAVV